MMYAVSPGTTGTGFSPGSVVRVSSSTTTVGPAGQLARDAGVVSSSRVPLSRTMNVSRSEG